jgi:hypothetical protein
MEMLLVVSGNQIFDFPNDENESLWRGPASLFVSWAISSPNHHSMAVSFDVCLESNKQIKLLSGEVKEFFPTMKNEENSGFEAMSRR